MEAIWKLNDPAVQAALISAIGSILTSAIAGVCAALVGLHFSERRRLVEKLATAKSDIEFLLAVEQVHCDRHQQVEGQSMKLLMRKAIKAQGYTWSGKFTPGRVASPEADRLLWRQAPLA